MFSFHSLTSLFVWSKVVHSHAFHTFPQLHCDISACIAFAMGKFLLLFSPTVPHLGMRLAVGAIYDVLAAMLEERERGGEERLN